MNTKCGSLVSRRWCSLPRWVRSKTFHPKILLLLAVILLATTVGLLFFWGRLSSPDKSPTTERNYGIVVDAGSSSSKIHLFQWPPHDGDPAKLLTIKPLTDEFGDPRIKKVEPGISTFVKSPETAFTSIQPLLEFAMAHIPASHHQQTLLYIFGTAGMRLLQKEDQDRIVKVLYDRVSQEYPFHVPEDGVQVIAGKLEGVFSWITLNYLLGRLSPEYQHPPDVSSVEGESGGDSEKPPQQHSISTVGCIDMGGASLQVAFEVPADVEVPPESVVEVNLGCGLGSAHGSQHKHKVFVSTYLGYGTNEARARYYRQLLKVHLDKSNVSTTTHLHSLRDPCAPLDSTENITIEGHTLKIRGLGDFGGCKKSLLPLLQNPSVTKDRGSGGVTTTPCVETEPGCNLIQQFQRPPLSLKYESLDFYGTSEFWYTMRDVLRIGGHYTSYSFEKASRDYCQTNWRVLLDRFLKKLYIYADYYRLKSQCMKSAWLSLVLHEGLGFPKDSISLHSVASMDGQSVQWALGALLYNTRFLPLREVQLIQHQISHHSSPWDITGYLSTTLTSSFLLPFLMVLCVATLLLCCRHRRPAHYLPSSQSQPPLSPTSIHRSQSLNSLVKIHRRMSSLIGGGSSLQMADMASATPGGGTPADFAEYSGGNGGRGLGGTRTTGKLKFIV